METGSELPKCHVELLEGPGHVYKIWETRQLASGRTRWTELAVLRPPFFLDPYRVFEMANSYDWF